MDTKTYNVNLKAKKTLCGGLALNLNKDGKKIGSLRKQFDTDMSIILKAGMTIAQRQVYYWYNDKQVYDKQDLAFVNQPPRTEIDKVKIDNTLTDINSVFSGYTLVKEIDVSDWDTSKITAMADVFSNCKSLTYLDLSSWDTSKVTVFERMFWNCQSLERIDGVFDMKSCVKGSIFPISYFYEDMFKNCSKLKNVKIKNPPDSFLTETNYDKVLGRRIYGYELAGLRQDQFEIVS